MFGVTRWMIKFSSKDLSKISKTFLYYTLFYIISKMKCNSSMKSNFLFSFYYIFLFSFFWHKLGWTLWISVYFVGVWSWAFACRCVWLWSNNLLNRSTSCCPQVCLCLKLEKMRSPHRCTHTKGDCLCYFESALSSKRWIVGCQSCVQGGIPCQDLRWLCYWKIGQKCACSHMHKRTQNADTPIHCSA